MVGDSEQPYIHFVIDADEPDDTIGLQLLRLDRSIGKLQGAYNTWWSEYRCPLPSQDSCLFQDNVPETVTFSPGAFNLQKVMCKLPFKVHTNRLDKAVMDLPLLGAVSFGFCSPCR